MAVLATLFRRLVLDLGIPAAKTLAGRVFADAHLVRDSLVPVLRAHGRHGSNRAEDGPAALRKETAPPTTRSLVLLLVVVTLMAWTGSLAIAAFWKPAMVNLGTFLAFPSSKMPFYILYYCLGISAYRRRWFNSPGRLGSVWAWLLVCVVLSPVSCSLTDRLVADQALKTNLGFMAGITLCKALLCMGFLGFLLTFGQRFCNRPSRFNRHMATHSYRTYLLHITVVLLVQLALSQWSALSGITVLLACIVLSLLGSHLASLLVGKVQALTTPKAPREDRIDGQLAPKPETG